MLKDLLKPLQSAYENERKLNPDLLSQIQETNSNKSDGSDAFEAFMQRRMDADTPEVLSVNNEEAHEIVIEDSSSLTSGVNQSY